MRIVLTIIAVVLVAMLSTALVAPLFVDWSSHRAEIDARLSAISGGKVALTGPINLRLLPTPYLEVGEGSVSGDSPDAPKLSFESARLELALVKMVSGAIRFTEIRLEKPVLTIARGGDGSLRLPVPPPNRADVVGFDRLVLRDGRMRISGFAEDIGGVQLEADAQSLAGPFHVSGQLSGPGGAPIIFRLASEKTGPNGLPIRGSVETGPGRPALDFDGLLSAAGSSLSGSAALIGAAVGPDGPTPWQVTGDMTADLNHVTIAPAEVRFGPEERSLRADGSVTLSYGSTDHLSVALKMKQGNLDALLRRNGEDAVAPARAGARLYGALAPLFEHPGALEVDASLSAETIILGADTLSDVSASLRSALGAPLRTKFETGLPGRSSLAADGELEMGNAARFRGGVNFASEDFASLRDWASQGAPDLGAKAAAVGEALAYRSVALSGDIEASGVGFSGKNLKVVLDRSTLTGSLGFARPVGADPARLSADLSSDSLDVATLPNVNASAALLADLDLSLSLNANALHITQVNETEIESGSLALKVTKRGKNITIDRLKVENLGGAFVDAQGVIGRDEIVTSGHLRADRLQDFAVLISRVAPGDWSRALAERARLLSPTSLAFEAHAGGGLAEGPHLTSLKANGLISQTQAALSVDPGPRGDGQVVALSLDSPDSGALLHQLGLNGTTNTSDRARVTVRGSGAWGPGYALEASGALAGVDVLWRGRLLPAAQGEEAWLFGQTKLKGANVSPLLFALGLAPAGNAIWPIDAAADMTLRGDRWTATRIAATVAGVKATGELGYQPVLNPDPLALPVSNPAPAGETVHGAEGPVPPPPAEVTGDLSLDRLRLGDLAALALGVPQPVKAGARWSDAKFAAPPLTLPRVAAHVRIGALDVNDGLVARGFAGTLRLDKGKLGLDEIRMTMNEGAVSGHATLRRDNGSATLTGALSADSLAVSAPGFSGRVGATLDFGSTGRSPAALIEGLAGSGTARFSGAELSRSDPGALDRLVARAQAPEAQLDETNIAFFFGNELDKAPLPIPNGPAPIALNAGAIKFGPLAIPRLRGDAVLSATLDLRRLSLETRLSETIPAEGLKFWSAPPPNASFVVLDALDAPKRHVDVSALSAGLATQAIARESERIAALEADIRERAFFNRRLKGERFIDRRNAEIEDWRIEQARLKGIAERLAAEREEAEKAASEKAAAEKAATEKAAAEKAAAEKAVSEPELPPDLPNDTQPIANSPLTAKDSATRVDELGANTDPPAVPMPPTRPRIHSATEHATPMDPTSGGLY